MTRISHGKFPHGPNPSQNTARSGSCGFTLIELLTTVAIIAILSGLGLSAAHRTKVQAKIRQARLEMAHTISALQNYEAAYGRFPISFEAGRQAEQRHEDITYGGVIQETQTWVAGPGYQTNNSELMAPLLDLEFYGDGAPTINRGHVRNPQRMRFLELSSGGGTNVTPGLGVDGQYRDPWGSPYVITLDLNHDGRVWDFMYREPEVSADPVDPKRGLCGLNPGIDHEGRALFEVPGPVTIWSAGPDRHLSTLQKANAGVNRDNILSWRL